MAKAKKLETKKEVSMSIINKNLALLKQCEYSLRQGKKIDHANAVVFAITALNLLHNPTDPRLIFTRNLLLGLDTMVLVKPSKAQVQKLQESPLGREPEPKRKVKPPPAKLFSISEMKLSALCLYRQLTSHRDRQPRYTLLSFAGATPEQAYKWRDWSVNHFHLIFDYLFNPEPLAEGLVNNTLGLSEAGFKSVAVA